MIKFGIRQSFENIEQIEERFSNLPVPIELALPYHWNIYEPVRMHLMEIAEKIKGFHAEILSIHAVQAPITNDEFRIWGKEIADFAKILGAKIITVHPNNTNKNQGNQEKALKNMVYFKRAYQGEVVFCIETFTGNRRIFDPDEIVESGLSMTLDVAHIYDNEKIWHLLKTAKENIKHVHLSAKRDGQHHLPVDDFCKDVVDHLVESKWDGSVVLEYLPEFHSRMIPDLRLLEQRYK
ncbi:MAG: hypothetical protein Q8O22_07775 [Candidatus Omnitrophota bacterium]|nr:hypothetical protein [Candidatus Omnitrophota bacterium]